MLVSAAVEAAGRVLVDRFDVIVDLHDIDADAVLVGPFLDDALVWRRKSQGIQPT